MNAKQKEQVKKLIASDCKIRFHYFCNGKTCAIGRLAKAARYPLRHIKISFMSNKIESLPKLAACIERKFGLTMTNLIRIQMENDNEEDRVVRIKSILDYVETLPVK